MRLPRGCISRRSRTAAASKGMVSRATGDPGEPKPGRPTCLHVLSGDFASGAIRIARMAGCSILTGTKIYC